MANSAGVSEITEQTISFLPVSETGDDAGRISDVDTVDGTEVSLESAIIGVLDNQENGIPNILLLKAEICLK